MAFGLAVAALMACLAGLALDGRRRERRLWYAWDLDLTPKGAQTYKSLEQNVLDRAELLDLTLRRALDLGTAGAPADAEARRVLATAADLAQRFSTTMLELLEGMDRFSRLTAAMTSVPSLAAGGLHRPSLSWRAHGFNLVAPLLVSAHERFRLRLFTLRASYRGAAGQLRRLAARRRPASPSDWRAVAALRQDLHTLTAESLGSLRSLLTSLGARPRTRVTWLTEGQRS